MKRFLSGIGGISSCFYAIMYGTIATRSAMEGCAGSQEFETKLKIKFYWRGKGIQSKCYDDKGNCIVECDKAYYRPLEVDTLLGDSKKARKELKWKPKYKIKDLVTEMVNSELSKQSL